MVKNTNISDGKSKTLGILFMINKNLELQKLYCGLSKGDITAHQEEDQRATQSFQAEQMRRIEDNQF